MLFLSLITVLFSLLSTGLSQGYPNGQQSRNSGRQSQLYRPLKAVVVLNGKSVNGVITFAQTVCIFFNKFMYLFVCGVF